MTAAERPSRVEIAGFAIGSVGTGLFSTVPSVLLLFFMTDTLGLPPLLGATAIFVPKVWSLITDPLIGNRSDNTRTRWGRRRPWMLAGAVLLTLGFSVLFRIPPVEGALPRFGWMLLIYTFCATAYSMFAVPYVAIPSEMSASPQTRNTIMSWRMIFVTIGVLLGAAGAPALVSASGGGPQGYGRMSLVLAFITGAAMLVAVVRVRSRGTSAEAVGAAPFGQELRAVATDRLLRHLAAAFLLQAVATSVTSAVLPYAASHLLGRDESLVGTLLFIQIVASLFCIPAWDRIARWRGKRWAFVVAAVCCGSVSASLVLLRPGYPLLLLEVQFLLNAFGFAGLQVLPFSMVTDVIQHDMLARGRRREGIYTGIWTATEKLSYAIGPTIAASTLAVGGYRGAAGGTVDQPASALLAITTSLSVIPACLFLAAAWLVSRYPLTEARLRELAS